MGFYTSGEPVGQRAFTRPGACCRPVTNACALAEAAIVAENAGAPIKGNPAIRAESTSPKAILVVLSGSTAVTMGSMLRVVLVVAKLSALYQSLKNALMSMLVRAVLILF